MENQQIIIVLLVIVIALVGLNLFFTFGKASPFGQSSRLIQLVPGPGDTELPGSGGSSGGNTGGGNTRDTNSPFVIITYPTSLATYDTNYPTIDLEGSTGDNKGVAQVTWGINTDGNGTAILSQTNTHWAANNLPLVLGQNVIMIRARDAADNFAYDVLVVTRTHN